MPTIYKDEIKHISERGQESKPVIKRQKLAFNGCIDDFGRRIISAEHQPENFTYVWQVNATVFAATCNADDKNPALYFGEWVDE